MESKDIKIQSKLRFNSKINLTKMESKSEISKLIEINEQIISFTNHSLKTFFDERSFSLKTFFYYQIKCMKKIKIYYNIIFF